MVSKGKERERKDEEEKFVQGNDLYALYRCVYVLCACVCIFVCMYACVCVYIATYI